MKLESPYEAASRTAHGNHKRTNDVSAVGGQRVRDRHREHDIRRDEFPRLGCGGLMRILESNALLRAALDPLVDECDLGTAEPTCISKIAVAWLWLPRRHVSAARRAC